MAPFPRKRAFRAKNEGSSDAAELQNSTMEFELPTQTLIIYRFEKLLVPRQPFSSRSCFPFKQPWRNLGRISACLSPHTPQRTSCKCTNLGPQRQTVRPRDETDSETAFLLNSFFFYPAEKKLKLAVRVATAAEKVCPFSVLV